jgi:hypothetical protein
MTSVVDSDLSWARPCLATLRCDAEALLIPLPSHFVLIIFMIMQTATQQQSLESYTDLEFYPGAVPLDPPPPRHFSRVPVGPPLLRTTPMTAPAVEQRTV